jgi:SAM-dependent methyltransferase
MSRLDQLLAHIDPARTGIEVAPYFNPAVPKATYPKVLTLDVFDTATLKERAAEDPQIHSEKIALIEDVDLVGDASSIGSLVSDKGLAGKIGYIVSSHNFEHLPNPIRFLRGCSEVLEPGGVLSMAVPDVRACFDIFRMPTRLVDWLVAYHEDWSQPSPETLFDAFSNVAPHSRLGVVSPATAINIANPAEFKLTSDLRETYATFVQTLDQPGPYRDAHCTVMFPETLELMLRDLRYIGLIDLEIIEVSQTQGIEFFVHLRKPVSKVSAVDKAEHLAVRQALVERINANLGSVVFRRERYLPHASRVPGYTKSFLKKIIGTERYAKLSAANRARRMK